jgi:hypothetical protein
MIIPSNHAIYNFPLNLEDNIQFQLKKIKEKIPFKIEHKIDISSNGIFEGKRNKSLAKYILHIINNKDLAKYDNFFITMGFKLTDKNWSLIIE